jgi:porin
MQQHPSQRSSSIANCSPVFASTVLALGASALCLWPAHAAPPALSTPISAEQNPGAPDGSSSFLESLKKSNFLLGDMFGLRTELSKYGASIAIQETSEVFGNATGGIRKGAEYDGLTQAILQVNTQRSFGWYGGLFNVSALDIHGRNVSADNLATIQTASGIEADRALRLWELWYDQKFLPEDRADVKIGLQSVDQEFIVSQNAGYFVNTMFGWPAVPSYDLPGGGPAYPLSALGVRLRYRPIDPINILVGVYNGRPSSNNNGDAQALNASGTDFPTRNGTLTFVELQYTYPALGSMVYPGAGAPLGRTYKIGAWYDSEAFDDQRFDTLGLPLASPASSGDPRRHRGDYSIYAVADQMLWRDGDDPNRSLSAFGRAMGAPQGDRNFLTFSLNLGLTYHDPVANRPDDTLGVGLGYAKVSRDVTAADTDAAIIASQSDPTSYNPIRHDETYIEATYQYQMRPWWQIQPDFQYVFSPGGGVANPIQPDQRVKNEAVFGVRTNVLF